MAHDSRLRIIEILKRRHQASVTELSQALALTPVTIRHHLDSLLSDGIVSQPVPRRRPGPGRPEMVYGLTPRADELTPRNFGEFCSCLLQAVDGSGGGMQAVLEKAGATLAASATRKGIRPSLTTVVKFLEERGYFPALEQDQDGQAIVLANCPYLEVARAMPLVCRFDIALLEALTGGRVVATSSIAQREPRCRLSIRPALAI